MSNNGKSKTTVRVEVREDCAEAGCTDVYCDVCHIHDMPADEEGYCDDCDCEEEIETD